MTAICDIKKGFVLIHSQVNNQNLSYFVVSMENSQERNKKGLRLREANAQHFGNLVTNAVLMMLFAVNLMRSIGQCFCSSVVKVDKHETDSDCSLGPLTLRPSSALLSGFCFFTTIAG